MNLKLFEPAPGTVRTVLLIVVRDRTRTPFERLCTSLRDDLEAVWASLVKPPEYAAAPLDDFFDVRYVGLPSYELAEEDFCAEATLMRRRFMPSEPDCVLPQDETRVHCSLHDCNPCTIPVPPSQYFAHFARPSLCQRQTASRSFRQRHVWFACLTVEELRA